MNKKILMVDDSVTTLMMERMILQCEPYDLLTAKNGSEAVEVANREQPDLILLDVVMPVMNGFEACKKLREHESTASIPIIMVTTRSEEKNVETGFEKGCNDYVTKPINGVELLSKVRNYLGE